MRSLIGERPRATGAVVIALVLFSLLLVCQGQEAPSLPAPMTSFNQRYVDATGFWGDCTLGANGCRDLISTHGCLVTCIAMVLDYYRISLFVPAHASCTGRAQLGMNPGLLNDWLGMNGGFGRCMQDPFGECCLEWSKLPEQVQLSFHANSMDVTIDRSSQQMIDTALKDGFPVVAGVHWDTHCRGNPEMTENCHWVVITGKSGGTYDIVDPRNGDSKSQHGISTTRGFGRLRKIYSRPLRCRGAPKSRSCNLRYLARSKSSSAKGRLLPQRHPTENTERRWL